MSPPAPTDPGRAAPGTRRLVIGAGLAALAAGAGLSAWRLKLDAPADKALDLFFSQVYPRVPGAGLADVPGPDRQLALGSLKGRALVVNFWATWCPPCVEEMPELSELAEKWRRKYGQRVETIGLGVDSLGNVIKFYEKMPVKYPLLASGTAGLELLRQMGNEAGGLPFTVVIAPSARISERILGRFKGPDLDRALEKALARG